MDSTHDKLSNKVLHQPSLPLNQDDMAPARSSPKDPKSDKVRWYDMTQQLQQQKNIYVNKQDINVSNGT